MDQPQSILFRCPPELEPILPRPIAAVLGLPDWFKAMPQRARNTLTQEERRGGNTPARYGRQCLTRTRCLPATISRTKTLGSLVGFLGSLVGFEKLGRFAGP
jgi:hypothetical protein